MIIDKIRNKFKEITTPILLFFDPEQEYRDEVLAISEPDFKVLEVNNNYFKIFIAASADYFQNLTSNRNFK